MFEGEVIFIFDALNAKHKRILQFILDRDKTTYDELAAYTNQSNKTVAKYVNDIRSMIEGSGVRLIVRQNKGIYLEGDKRELKKFVHNINPFHSSSKEDREVYIYSRFLTTSHHLKVQDLADELYVSRSTLENALKTVRQKFIDQGYEITSSKDGMVLEAEEDKRRYLISQLINYFWGDITYLDGREESLKRQLKMTPEIENILNIDTLYQVTSVINKFSQRNKLVLTDYEYRSLVIHLTIALDRIREDEFFKQPSVLSQLLNETLDLIQLIEQVFLISIPSYEKEYMNNHILAIKRNERNQVNEEDLKIGSESRIRRVILHGLERMDVDDELLKSLTLHLGSAIKRLQLNLSIHNPYTEKIKLSFPRAFDSAISLTSTIEEAYNIQLNDDEIAYIALHFEAFFERNPDTKQKQKKDVMLVCSSGLGTSKLLKQRINHNFSHALHVTRVLSTRDLKQTEITEAFIISTIPLDEIEVPVIVVSSLLDNNDIISINRELADIPPSENIRMAFLNIVRDELLFTCHKENDNKNKALTTICEALKQNGYADNGILNSALRREKLASTAMDIFAIPHAEMDYIINPGIAVYVNRNGINWGGKLVYVVFFFALNNQVKSTINQIYEYFNDLISNQTMLENLSLAKDKNELYQLLRKV